MEYFYPEYKLKLGTYVITEGVTVEYLLDNKLKIDWLEIVLSEKLQSIVSAKLNDVVRLDLGYNGAFSTVFVGLITDIGNNKYTVKSNMIKVLRTEIANSFLDCTPDEVFTYILNKSGLSSFKIDLGITPTKNLLNISKTNGFKALGYTERTFSINELSYFFEGETLNILRSKPKGKIYEFVYGVNIKTLEKLENNQYCLKTVLVPFINVLDTINVKHILISGDFIVNKIVGNINENGFIEMKLYFNS